MPRPSKDAMRFGSFHFCGSKAASFDADAATRKFSHVSPCIYRIESSTGEGPYRISAALIDYLMHKSTIVGD